MALSLEMKGVLIAVISLIGAALVTYAAWPHLRRQKVLLVALAVMSLTGVVLSSVTYGSAITSDVRYRVFVGAVVLGALGILAYVARTALPLIGPLRQRIRLYLEERKDPVLRQRREAISLYERSLSLWADAESDAERRLASVGAVASLYSAGPEGRASLARHLNVRFHAGNADDAVIGAFLEEEARLIEANAAMTGNHIPRLEQQMLRMRVSSAAS